MFPNIPGLQTVLIPLYGNYLRCNKWKQKCGLVWLRLLGRYDITNFMNIRGNDHTAVILGRGGNKTDLTD